MEERLYLIYLVTNIVNNKKYVGQTVKSRGFMDRWREHVNESKSPTNKFLSAIKHYGEESFNIILIEDDIPESLIDQKEQYYINLYNTYYLYNEGYNMTFGGQGVHGYHHTEKDKEKISTATKLLWEKWRLNPDQLAIRNKKISDKQKNCTKSEETKAKISAARYNEDGSSKFSGENNPFFHKQHTQESKNLMREHAHRKELDMLDKQSFEILQHFNSLSDAYKFLEINNITHSNTAAIGRISYCANNTDKHIAYGYRWKFSESVTTIPAGSTEEDLLPLEVPSHFMSE